ncbi:LRR receptor-like kinase family protein [Quillaja saponaria]|uniref:non-specific serine/threonine protein kinase n=1 Tax=Quillaja saponaria TaxID=32244 RepID=A0AAD7LE33_QUISA|nr:LRR receptor-like kinase family protein [Quillaja saponaria]
MSEEETDSWRFPLIIFLVLISATVVPGDSLDRDREVLLKLKAHFNKTNHVNMGNYSEWDTQSSNPCDWYGVTCSSGNETAKRVIGIDLSESNISGEIFQNFSELAELARLDLSKNTFSGVVPPDLGRCQNLVFLNLSNNFLEGDLNLTGLSSLQTLDLSFNRLRGEVGSNFPAICENLVTLNISRNNFTGRLDNSFDQCWKLQHLDLSSNNFSGVIWIGFARLTEFSVSENYLSGSISSSLFTNNCNLQALDLSENRFTEEVPREISNCTNLVNLNLWGNSFSGKIPLEMGSISSLEALYLGNNNFSSEIPETLANLSKLTFLDLSRNHFGDDIQETFGRLTQVKFLLLHSNNYTGGIYSSGILKLPNILRLDLSNNNFSGPLPVEISQMSSLNFLVLANNQFNGTIPPEFGHLPRLQALDLSSNRLTGSIPPSFGNLTSLLWLMLANNLLTGEIPRELGNCTSLLWLNLENNMLSGGFPSELTNIGRNAMATFEANRESDHVTAGSGECLAMKRWIPADYPPFSFVYNILTRKNCRRLWDKLLKGYAVFPICASGSSVGSLQISGYVQLSRNRLMGEVPSEVGNMQSFSMLHLGVNKFHGKFPPEIGRMPLVVLNLTENEFSGEIPMEIADIKCLQNLDFSYNNFSGTFPESLGNLAELSKFNISYNPLISGVIPTTWQFATFEKGSYLGDPYLHLPQFIDNTDKFPKNPILNGNPRKPTKLAAFLVFIALTLAFLIFGVLSVIVCLLVKSPVHAPGYLLEKIKDRHDLASSSGSSSPWLSDTIKVIRLDKTAFTHTDILNATGNFSAERIVGKGGFGTVYRGVLPDGRQVAVKKLQSEGIEGEREFRAEMEVLSGTGFGWPHPNLVTLYGWCLNGSEKILVYEYMEGGSLEDLVPDRIRFTWRRRIKVAIDVAQALVYLHHECHPSIVHRDVKASNVLLDKDGKARVTDFGLARVVDAGDSHVSTVIAGTVGYVAPEYGQTWHATTKGDVYSFGVLAMELATGRRAVDGGEECLVEWARRVMGYGRHGLSRFVTPVVLMGSGLAEGAEEMCELLRIGVTCSAETPHARPNMKEVLAMLFRISSTKGDSKF